MMCFNVFILKSIIFYFGFIGGIGFCCSCGCIVGDLELGVRFFWCFSNRSRFSFLYYIESKFEEENLKI